MAHLALLLSPMPLGGGCSMRCSARAYLTHPPSLPPSFLPVCLAVNGRRKTVGVKNLGADEVRKCVEQLRTETGVKLAKVKNNIKTETPSTQGNWHPFMR